MTFREMLLLSYGVLMGTSTPFLKPAKRFLFPAYKLAFEEGLGIFLGGSGICGVLRSGTETLIINVNQGEAAQEWRAWCTQLGVDFSKATVVFSSTLSDFSGGLAKFADCGRILVGPASEKVLKRDLGGLRVECLREETVLQIGGERVRIVPAGPAASATDLAVFLETRSILFTGPLVYNRVHPPLHATRPGFNPPAWVEKVDRLLERFKPRVVVPAEGDITNEERAREFVQYLRDLMNPQVEFSECRRKYDWPEIPRYTSLEENFNLLRENLKTFTSIGL